MGTNVEKHFDKLGDIGLSYLPLLMTTLFVHRILALLM